MILFILVFFSRVIYYKKSLLVELVELNATSSSDAAQARIGESLRLSLEQCRPG